MSKIYLYGHGGSGNHGCEAIVRATLKLLEGVDREKVLVSTRPEEDQHYGLSQLCTVLREQNPYSKASVSFVKAYLDMKLKKDYTPMDKLAYKATVDQVQPGDIALSIGGDNYCYADVKRYGMMHDMYLTRGAKTVLWGCSVEPKVVADPVIAADLKRYSLITARETISYEALKAVNPNTVLVSDPAFALNVEKTEIPSQLQGKEYVGINLSPMIIDNETNAGITMKNYENLVEYILEKTDMSVALVPHVVWDFTDDRKPLNQLYQKYQASGRVVLVEEQSCEKLKYVISKAKYFIGARTHSTIAAYSTGVPTLVVGYSVKARGIARDIFGAEEGYVLPVQSLQKEGELLKQFCWMEQQRDDMVEKLSRCVSGGDYSQRAYRAVEALKKL